jgi:hypothetical protein
MRGTSDLTNLLFVPKLFKRLSAVLPNYYWHQIQTSPTCIDMIKNVQRNFTKRIALSYPERLTILYLHLLGLRRLRFDLIYCFEVFNHLAPFNTTECFTIYTPAARSRPELASPAKANPCMS